MTDVVIVGGGIAGLTTAWELARGGASVTVLEAAATVGGKLRAGTSAGVDVGAESFAIRTSAVADLIRDAELPVSTVAPNPGGAHLVSMDDDGRIVRHPLPRRTVLGMPADPTAPDVAVILGTAGVARALAERALPPQAGEEPSLFDLAVARFGVAVAERLVDPLCRSVYSQPSSRLHLSRLHPAVWEGFVRTGSLTEAVAEVAAAAPAGAAVRGVSGGMWTLATALRDAAEAQGVMIVTDASVDAVVPGGVIAGATTYAAERIVLAVGETEARRLLDIEPQTHETTVLVVSAVVTSGALDDRPVGSGVIVAPAVPTRAKALTHVSAKWGWVRDALPAHTHIVRVSARDAATSDLTVPAVLAAEITTLTGVPIEAADIDEIAETRWPDAVVAPGDHLATAAARVGVDLVGAVVAGTGLAAIIPQARASARALLRELPVKGNTP